VAAVAGAAPAHVAAVADVFRHPERSFITPSADVALHPDTILDISHESLIRQWQRLNAWAEQEAEAAETYRRLAQTARLWQRGQAALWSTPDLENALAWKERERPTSAWAIRYGQDFALAMEFLDVSESQRLAEQQREEAARQSKLRQVRRQLALALVGLCIAVGLALWAMRERQRAGEARNAAEQALVATTQAREEAERERAHAERSAQAEAGARGEAEKRQGEAESARTQAEQHRRAAVVQVLVAQALRRQDERGALLARQAYLFNEQGRGRALPQIDAALRAVLDTRYFSHTLHFPASTRFLNSADRQKLVVMDSDGTMQLWDLRQLNATPTVLRGPEKLQFVLSSLHPDGQTLATVYIDPTRVFSSSGNQVLVWNLRQPQAPPTVLGDDTQQFMSVAFSPDGQTLAAGTIDLQRSISAGRRQSRVFLWPWGQPGTAPTVLDIPESLAVPLLEFSPDSQTLATLSLAPGTSSLGAQAGTLRLWDVRHPEAAPTVFGSAEDLVVSMEFSDDGHTLATGHTESQKRSGIGVDFQKVGRQSLGSTIQVRDLQQRTANPLVLRSPEAFFSSMALSPDGQTLATGSNTGSIRLWNLRQPDVPPTILDTQEMQVNELKFSPDGNILISTDQANTRRVWELRQSNPTCTVLRGHTDEVSSVAFSLDGYTLVSGGKDHTVRLWDLRQPDITPTVLSDYKAPVLSVALSSDGQWLATGSFAEAQTMKSPSVGNTLWLWNLHQPHPTPTILSGSEGPVSTVAFSSNGQWLAAAIFVDRVKISAGDNTGSVRLWEPHQPEAAPIVLDIPETGVAAVAFSPDSQHLATSSMLGGPVQLWHVHQRNVIRSFPGNPEHVTLSVAFSSDGQRLASGSSDGMVRLWDLRQPEAAPVVLPGDGVAVYTVAFSPDNQRLAAGSLNNTARLWDLRQLEVPPIVLRGHTGPVFSVAFSPDGQRLATGSHDQTIRLWQVHTANLADMVCERVWRNLTLDEWRQFVGADIPYERTCPNLPIHPSALETGQEQTTPSPGGG
jgi:WD40 repeat protein